jgi:superfamily II DNA or RNA helicase
MKDKFRENFEVIRSDVLRANYGSNPWQDKNQVVTSISWFSRMDDARESLLRSHWDLIVVDEAHKMSVSSQDHQTLAEVALTNNEYKTAERLRSDYWLYVVYDSGSKPVIHPIKDPVRMSWEALVKIEHYHVKA